MEYNVQLRMWAKPWLTSWWQQRGLSLHKGCEGLLRHHQKALSLLLLLLLLKLLVQLQRMGPQHVRGMLPLHLHL